MSGKKIHQTHFTQPAMPWRKEEEEETVELKRERPIIFNAEMWPGFNVPEWLESLKEAAK